eukprot:10431465-Lingulodinium_polyedra.AAC.1
MPSTAAIARWHRANPSMCSQSQSHLQSHARAVAGLRACGHGVAMARNRAATPWRAQREHRARVCSPTRVTVRSCERSVSQSP